MPSRWDPTNRGIDLDQLLHFGLSITKSSSLLLRLLELSSKVTGALADSGDGSWRIGHPRNMG
jgi:hypothetical protein